MTKNELLQAFEYRLNGLSYQEISEKMGYSRQNIQAELQKVLQEYKSKRQNCIQWHKNQPKLAKIIFEEYGNLTRFCNETGCGYRSTHNLLQGVSYPRPASMKKLLKATGLRCSDIMNEFYNTTESE